MSELIRRSDAIAIIQNAKYKFPTWPHIAEAKEDMVQAIKSAPTIDAWNRRAGKDNNALTNADRIRSTTDEELAKMLAYNDVFYEEICGSDERTRVCDNDCVACTLEWLRQRAKEEHHEKRT